MLVEDGKFDCLLDYVNWNYRGKFKVYRNVFTQRSSDKGNSWLAIIVLYVNWVNGRTKFYNGKRKFTGLICIYKARGYFMMVLIGRKKVDVMKLRESVRC